MKTTEEFQKGDQMNHHSEEIEGEMLVWAKSLVQPIPVAEGQQVIKHFIKMLDEPPNPSEYEVWVEMPNSQSQPLHLLVVAPTINDIGKLAEVKRQIYLDYPQANIDILFITKDKVPPERINEAFPKMIKCFPSSLTGDRHV